MGMDRREQGVTGGRLPTRCAVASLFLLAGCSGKAPAGTGAQSTTGDCVFHNPVAAGQDPWVVREGDQYYLVESRGGGIYVYRSRELTDPKQNPVRIWAAPDTGWNRSNVWAPELHHIDGRWYVYYAAGRSGPPFTSQRAGVLQSVGDDPQGEYVDRGMLYTGDDVATSSDPKWAIDLTVSRLGGTLYAVWSGWERNADTDKTPQHLYIAPMSNPWTISGDRVRISSPTADWERGPELDLQEGPEFLKHGDDVFLIYSTNDSWLPSYRLGELRLSGPDDDPLLADSWVKSAGPVFEGTADVYGVGHASFTTSPDGSEDWIVYHTKRGPEPGWDRVIQMQEFGWNADGSPDFGVPAAPGTVLPVPSRQCSTS